MEDFPQIGQMVFNDSSGNDDIQEVPHNHATPSNVSFC